MLAKQVSNELYIGPELALPVSHMAVKSAIKDIRKLKLVGRVPTTAGKLK